MLERRRRCQARLEPWVPMPTGTTTTRRTRRVCVNIEANGSGSPRGRRRRRRELLDPYSLPYSYVVNPMLQTSPGTYQWCGDSFYNSGYLQDAGEGFEEYHSQEEPPQKGFSKASGQQAINDLRDILNGLENQLETEEMKDNPGEEKPEEEAEPEAEGDNEEPEKSQLSVLTKLMCETIGRLNGCIFTHSPELQNRLPAPWMTNYPINGRGTPPPMQVLQPVILQTLPPPTPPANPHYYLPPVEAESAPPKKPHLERLPWLKERKRKRPPKMTAYIHLQNQGCSTEDLDVLPRILEASKSSMRSCNQALKDASTTMWCPMECCEEYCGLVGNQKILPADPGNPLPIGKGNFQVQPVPKAPPPSQQSEEELIQEDQEMYPCSSSISSSSDYRQEGGNLRYTYMEEEEEEQEEWGDGEQDKDEWYRKASTKLARLEMEQEYLRLHNTKNKKLQTDECLSSESSSLRIIATTDQAVSTTELNELVSVEEPIKIARICRRSSIRKPQKPKSRRGKFLESNKVMFQIEAHSKAVQVAPTMRSIGTDSVR
ncbi:hypothetical protein KR009_002724, partial [Drosophila setifemur]